LVDRVSGAILVPRLEATETRGEATRGLLGRDGLLPDQGLLIRDCRSIHMFFMRFAIDVVFLDSEMRICKIVEELRPWRLAWALLGKHALELPAGAIRRIGMRVGQEVEIR
jgi:uncharacterized protein